MALPFPVKPGPNINQLLAISQGLVRAVFLTKGSGAAVERVGGGEGTLQNGAVWSVADADLGTTVDFSAGPTASINFGQGGLSHGNGDLSIFFGGECPVIGGVDHNAGGIAGTGVDSFHFGITGSGGANFVLSNVVALPSASGVPFVAGSKYTAGMAYRKGVSVRYHVYNQTTSAQITPDTVSDANSPAQVADYSTVGSKWGGVESWASDLGFLLVYNRALADIEFESLHVDPYLMLRVVTYLRRKMRKRHGFSVSAPGTFF